MGLRDIFLQILAIDSKPPRPNVDDYCAIENERLALEHKCACYERELVRLGYRAEHLRGLLSIAGSA